MSKDDNVVPMQRGATKNPHEAPRFFPEAEGHEKILAGCKKNRHVMRLDLVGSGELIGQITQFDRWSITIKDEWGDLATVYKHSIRYFEKYKA